MSLSNLLRLSPDPVLNFVIAGDAIAQVNPSKHKPAMVFAAYIAPQGSSELRHKTLGIGCFAEIVKDGARVIEIRREMKILYARKMYCAIVDPNISLDQQRSRVLREFATKIYHEGESIEMLSDEVGYAKSGLSKLYNTWNQDGVGVPRKLASVTDILRRHLPLGHPLYKHEPNYNYAAKKDDDEDGGLFAKI